MIDPEFIGPYATTNIVSAALVVSAYKCPRVTLILFVLIFLAAGVFNSYIALTNPEDYLLYGDIAVLLTFKG